MCLSSGSSRGCSPGPVGPSKRQISVWMGTCSYLCVDVARNAVNVSENAAETITFYKKTALGCIFCRQSTCGISKRLLRINKVIQVFIQQYFVQHCFKLV